MAGEGIEYCWAFSKVLYWRKPLESKKIWDTFEKLIKECPSTSILKPAQYKKFSRRAHQYLCTYYILHVHSQQGQEGAQPEEGRAGKQQLQFRSIKCMKKLFQSHWCTLDFDKGFVKAAIKESAVEAAWMERGTLGRRKRSIMMMQRRERYKPCQKILLWKN